MLYSQSNTVAGKPDLKSSFQKLCQILDLPQSNKIDLEEKKLDFEAFKKEALEKLKADETFIAKKYK